MLVKYGENVAYVFEYALEGGATELFTETDFEFGEDCDSKSLYSGTHDELDIDGGGMAATSSAGVESEDNNCNVFIHKVERARVVDGVLKRCILQ